jgi:hypothetical protein
LIGRPTKIQEETGGKTAGVTQSVFVAVVARAS